MTDYSTHMQNLLVEALLVRLALLYAPRVAPAGWRFPGDLDQPRSTLARRLADEGVLVILGDRSSVPSDKVPQHAESAILAYKVLYDLLTQRLFPRMMGIRHYYQSYSQRLLVMFFLTEAPPVTQALAGFVAPYVAQRPAGVYAPAGEVVKVMDAVLQALEPRALAPSQYNNLRSNGAAMIQWMVNRPLKQMPLLTFDRPLFTPPPPPPTLPGIRPDVKAAPAPPAQRPPYLDPDSLDNTTELIPGVPAPDDAGDTAPSHSGDDTSPLPPVPGRRPGSPQGPPAPLPYRPNNQGRSGAGKS